MIFVLALEAGRLLAGRIISKRYVRKEFKLELHTHNGSDKSEKIVCWVTAQDIKPPIYSIPENGELVLLRFNTTNACPQSSIKIICSGEVRKSGSVDKVYNLLILFMNSGIFWSVLGPCTVLSEMSQIFLAVLALRGL